jgi:hypothetical protein
METIINNQTELDNLSLEQTEDIIIIGGTLNNPLILRNHYKNADVILSGNAVIEMWENSQVKEMRENSQVKEMWENSQVNVMRGSSQVNVMRENSQVNMMWDNSQVNMMRGSSQVNMMRENSQVNVMRGSSQVKEMWGSSQVKEMRENSQVKKMWENSQVKEMRENSQVKKMRENSQVNMMWENSQVNVMWENSQVNMMRENSQVNMMWENSQVKEMWENSQVKEMRENSQVNVMRGSSQVNMMRENSQVKEMRENSQVKEMWGSSTAKILDSRVKVRCYGYNYIFLEGGKDQNNILLNDTSQILTFNTFQTKPTLDFYLKNYKTEVTDTTVRMFKAVHKIADEYISDYNTNFKYVIGETIKHEVDTNIEESCSVGLHASTLDFAVNFGLGWGDMAIIGVEIPKDKIVISKYCDGKIRTSELTVIRELDKKEYEGLL